MSKELMGFYLTIGTVKATVGSDEGLFVVVQPYPGNKAAPYDISRIFVSKEDMRDWIDNAPDQLREFMIGHRHATEDWLSSDRAAVCSSGRIHRGFPLVYFTNDNNTMRVVKLDNNDINLLLATTDDRTDEGSRLLNQWIQYWLRTLAMPRKGMPQINDLAMSVELSYIKKGFLPG